MIGKNNMFCRKNIGRSALGILENLKICRSAFKFGFIKNTPMLHACFKTAFVVRMAFFQIRNTIEKVNERGYEIHAFQNGKRKR